MATDKQNKAGHPAQPLSTAALVELLGSLYTGLIGPDPRQDFLDRLRVLFGAESVSLALRFPSREAGGATLFSADAYMASQADPEVQWASQSFIPIGLFSPEGAETTPPDALAHFTGHVRETFTNSASDPNGDQILFSLVTAPTNATLGLTTGVFSWTPTEAQGNTTNLIRLRAFDSGSPSLSATQSFTVTVLKTNHAPVLPQIAPQLVGVGGI